MSPRATRSRVRSVVAYLVSRHRADLGIDIAYGGVRITNEAGSKDLSPRGTAREALLWLDGYARGRDDAKS